MGLFQKKRKEKINIELSSGLFLQSVQPGPEQRDFWGSMPKGVLSFLVVFGSLGGFLSAFDTEVNYVVAGFVLFACAMYFSLLFSFKSARKKDLFYILFFLIYVFGIYLFKSYVNSGFAAIVNIVRQKAEVYFGLNPGNEFAEKIDNRAMSLTITLIFIGGFAILVMNIFISNYMSLKFAVFTSMPLFIVPLYLQSEPNLFLTVCMFAGFVGIHIFKNNGHFKRGKGDSLFERDKGSVPAISYTQNNKLYRGIFLAIIGCAVMVGLFAAMYSEDEYRMHYRENVYKEATRPGVSSFVMYGLYSFMHSPYAGGGISGGNLKQFGGLRPTNETHLVVKYAPYDMNPVYLKAYTGVYYEDSTWYDGYTVLGTLRGSSSYFYTESLYREALGLKKEYKKNPQEYGKGKMKITNVGANPTYVYYPYYTLFPGDTEDFDTLQKNSAGMKKNETREFTYYTNSNYSAKTADLISYLYRDVPEASRTAIEDVILKMGLSLEKDYSKDPSVIDTVVEYLKNNYSYSYNPGQVPRGDDFVTYFLEDKKKGVCMHFATSATLIFRRLNIPARYVEGYAFGYGTVLDGKVQNDLKYEDFYKGNSTIGKTAVMQVDVKDSNAHAWVEVYEDGKGWRVADPTPSSMQDESGTDFWKTINNFWNNSPDLSLGEGMSFLDFSFMGASGARFVVMILFVLGLVIVIGRLAIKRIIQYRRWHTKDYQHNVLERYSQMCRRRAKKDAGFAKCSVPSEQMKYLANGENKEDCDINELIAVYERICFGPNEPREEEYKDVMVKIKKLFR